MRAKSLSVPRPELKALATKSGVDADISLIPSNTGFSNTSWVVFSGSPNRWDILSSEDHRRHGT